MSYATRIKEKKMAGGGKVLIATFPSHGQVSIVGSVLGGGRLAGNDILAEIHASMLLEGTAKRTKADIQVLLDEMGASLSFAIERDRLVFTARARGVHCKKLLALISEVLREPSFPKVELAHLKERTMAGLSLESQETRTQAGINLSHMIFDADHPDYQTSTDASRTALQALSRSDLVEYHARAIDARSLIVAVSGDADRTEVFMLIEKAFAKLPSTEVILPAFVPAIPSKARTSAVQIADKASIDYMLGVATGITKDHPDYPALLLGIQVLGSRSGFTGRLMQTVREVEGLTYGVYSYLAGFVNADGYIITWATFAPSLLAKGKAALMREIRKIVEEGATDGEVKKHQKMYEARSRVTVSNSGDLARVAHDIAVEGRKPSYLDEFPQSILRLKRAAVHAALKKYLVIENLSESAAGPIPEGS